MYNKLKSSYQELEKLKAENNTIGKKGFGKQPLPEGLSFKVEMSIFEDKSAVKIIKGSKNPNVGEALKKVKEQIKFIID